MSESDRKNENDETHESKDEVVEMIPNPKRKKSRMIKSLSTPEFGSLYRNQPGIDKSSPISLYRTVPSYRMRIRDLMTANIPILEKRSFLLCPHKYHCIQNAFMKGLWRTFAAAFIFKTSLSFLTSLFNGKIIGRNLVINWKLIGSIYLNQDSLLFAQFLALMSFTYKVIVCAMRRFRKKDPIWHKTVAGFIASFWVFLDDKSRRNTIALYCIVRALSDVVRLLVNYKKIPKIDNFDVAVFTASQVIIMHGAIKEPQYLDPKYYKWIMNMGNLNEKSVQIVLRNPVDSPFVPCYDQWHDHPSCLWFSTKDWFGSFARAFKMYLPVHFLPTVLFQPKKIIKNPMEFAQKKIINVCVSAVFLATYVFNTRYSICVTRNLIKSDPPWTSMFAGFMAGMSLFIENGRRRPELMLYCIPRALEWIMKKSASMSPNVKKLLKQNLLSVISFQIAIALWMTVINIPRGIQNSNSINMTVLNTIFGSKH